MTVSIRFPLGKAWLTVEGESAKDAMKAISDYADVFAESVCGACQSTELLPSHRTAKGYDFYEMVCLACGARLSFGQLKEGNRLFPKRRDQNGNEIGKEGESILMEPVKR